MSTEERPNPEQLLKAIHREEMQQKKGRLKIFIGMAAGVGKTYAMLEEAQELNKEGVDLVVGTVNTHGRKETAELLNGLKIVPEKIVSYRDKQLNELDLDAIIALHPQLVLIDELAHSNVPGLRHSKRWEDVIEILAHGIDVYATLNVQHIESLNDLVASITGITVRETVPDVVIEKASSIRLIDITVDELLERLQEGKVYVSEQSRVAILNFFQKDRLTALREIVLRYAAEIVDHNLQDMAPIDARISEWKPREKFLVAISPSPNAQRLIRITRRLAAAVNAPWIALYINTGRLLSEEENNQLAKNLLLARNLGAEVLTLNDPHIVDAIQKTVRQQGITQMILGRPPKSKFLGFFRRYELLDQLAIECKDVDIHVIKQEPSYVIHPRTAVRGTVPLQLQPYLIVLFLVGFFTGISFIAMPHVGYRLIGFLFLLGILSLSLFFKKGPVFFAAILYALIWELFFVPRPEQFVLGVPQDDAVLILYVLTAVITGILVDRAREHKEILEKSEVTTMALYEIIRCIATAKSIEDVCKEVTKCLERIFEGDFEISVKQPDGRLDVTKSLLITDEKEKNAAIWVFENGQEAGWSTDTLPSVQNLYVPLKEVEAVVGLLIYRPKVNRVFTIEQKNFLATVCQELGHYLERAIRR